MVRRVLTEDELLAIDEAAAAQEKAVILLACVGDGMPQDISGPALVRATQAAAQHLTQPALVVAVAAADHGSDDDQRLAARQRRPAPSPPSR